MSRTASSWEDLRKQARQLENEIDTKLVSFSKFGTTPSYGSAPSKSGDTAPLLNGELVFQSMASEIQQLLNRLSEVNQQMSDVSSQQTPSAALIHTLQRHRDILHDYNTEFQKTKAHLESRKEREDLLGSVRRDIEAYKSDSGRNRRLDSQLKESEHLRSSDRLIDEQINIAIETKEHLVSQREAFKLIQTRVNDLASRFPIVNSLMQRINVRKRRDSVILGCVIGLGFVLLVWYALR